MMQQALTSQRSGTHLGTVTQFNKEIPPLPVYDKCAEAGVLVLEPAAQWLVTSTQTLSTAHHSKVTTSTNKQ